MPNSAKRVRLVLGFVVLMGIMFGLLLLSWGLDDWRAFFSHPARAGLLLVGAVRGVPALFVSADVQPLRKGKKSVGGWVLLAWVVFGVFLVIWLPYADRRGLLVFRRVFDALRYVGLLLVAAGAGIRVGSLMFLGKQFSGYVTLQEDHQLVQTGIYSMIRHPMYLGLLLAMPGLALVFRSWLVFPAFAACAVFVLVRIRQEEKLLGEHFGAEFEAYRRRTWRLLPYIY